MLDVEFSRCYAGVAGGPDRPLTWKDTALMASTTTPDSAALATAIRAAQRATDAGAWADAARALRRAAGLADALAAAPATPPTPRRVQPAAVPVRPARPANPVDTAAPDAVAIADHLRGLDTTDDGAAYLAGLGTQQLRAVAAQVHLTRVDRLSATALRARIVQQAIGTHRKFASLRQW